jgi:diguanylate cyclase (GGDEF)-like protein
MPNSEPGVESVTTGMPDGVAEPVSSRPNAGLPRLQAGLGVLLDAVSRTLGVPVALLSREGGAWRFEAESLQGRTGERARGSRWTGLLSRKAGEREWLLIVPERPERWQETPGLAEIIDQFWRNLDEVAEVDDERRRGELHKRLYAFSRRLTRISDVDRTYAYILRAIAAEVAARTGSIAVFSEVDRALRVVATLGYPQAIVDHVRIASGDGVIGQTFATGRAAIGRAGEEEPRRLRYTTDSYIALALRASGRTMAVVTLTDRRDGQSFDNRDLVSSRLFVAPAALALDRLHVSESLVELTRAATVDAVTGLFNRRYFEARIQAEVQRARRQQQDLALLMVDIDDFKRINDTFGHLEGDRALRDVADLLRRGIRIFDLCARYGGEEFAIVMPGATRQVAVQVAERIREGMQDRSRLTPLPMTVSIGVAFLGSDQSEEDLIASADRALIAAKRAGKNVVKTS